MQRIIFIVCLLFCAGQFSGCGENGGQNSGKNSRENSEKTEQKISEQERLKALVLANIKERERLQEQAKDIEKCEINFKDCEHKGVVFSLENRPLMYLAENKLKIFSKTPMNRPFARIEGVNMDVGQTDIELEPAEGGYIGEFVLASCVISSMVYKLSLIDGGTEIAYVNFSMKRQ